MLGATPVAFFSTFGPRQMVLLGFWFGFYGVKVIPFFNYLATFSLCQSRSI